MVVVATPAALDTPLPAPTDFAARTLRIGVGDRLERELLLEAFEAAGYERVETVVEVGQWSVRGGIVDVFAPSHPSPARLEFFGDDVESIRRFDPTSQRSTDALDELLVLPLGAPAEDADGAARLLDYVPAAAPVIIDAPALLDETSEEAPGRRPLREIARRPAARRAGAAGRDRASSTCSTRRRSRASPAHFVQLTEALGRWRAEGLHGAAGRRRRAPGRAPAPDPARQRRRGAHRGIPRRAEAPAIVVGECSAGIAISAVGLVLLTEAEIFGARRRTLRRPKYQRGAALTAFTDLAVGDLVVHEDHGIGRYLGLRTMSVGDRDGDFLLLEYAEGDRLYVPGRAARPRLEIPRRRRGHRPARPPGRRLLAAREGVGARRAARDGRGAAEALRPARGGRGPSPSPPTRRGSASSRRRSASRRRRISSRAIEEAKRDMENRAARWTAWWRATSATARPRSRCAPRSRRWPTATQVAVLVPTTVLAQQHWSTFTDRFAPFPAKVELLSRFRSPKEQKAVVEGLRQGTVDVVIGTHRLLSKDVAFKKLGLLIVDEEHRFGVAHKERMKQLRASVDVLALTATPIPRTLYMSLSGVRDMSVIETPPLDRLPDRDRGATLQQGRHQGGARARARARRPGVLRAQPRAVAHRR